MEQVDAGLGERVQLGAGAELQNDLDFCVQHDVGVTPYQVLQGGLLTGKYTASSVLPDDDVRGPNAPYWS